VSELAQHWGLDPEITFLNHGSFGACPRPVLARQQALRERLEAEPARFFNREAPGLLAQARAELARFVAAPEAGLAFVPNTSSGINAILRSLPIEAGAELLVTDHEYNASRNVLDFVARKCGAHVVPVHLPFPLEDSAQVVEAVLGAVTPRTRLALLDHVTSQTALVLPIETLVPELEARGVAVLVDGAHGPGMLPVDLASLQPSWYVGNCHKWLCAPKAVGFLWAREDRRSAVRPAVISHGANAPVPLAERFRREFDWMGTTDPTPALCVPEAIRSLASLLSDGWEGIRRRNRALALAGRETVAEALEVDLPCPKACIGSMATLPVPEIARFGRATAHSALELDPLHDALFHEHRIEVPVVTCAAHPGRLLRISAHLYNRREDYERLAAALRHEL